MRCRPFCFLLRHANLATFALIAAALLTGAANGGPQRAPGGILRADAGESPVWLGPQVLAGVAALVVAVADAAVKLIRVMKQPAPWAVCPFAVDGISRCHGKPAPVPPTDEAAT
jgi:hypothetical protein